MRQTTLNSAGFVVLCDVGAAADTTFILDKKYDCINYKIPICNMSSESRIQRGVKTIKSQPNRIAVSFYMRCTRELPQ